jgi:CheY-like chemotaxis protein
MDPVTEPMRPVLPRDASQRLPLILVVDDDPDISTIFSEVLKEMGYRVEFAHDDKTAMQRAIAGDPALILIDFLLPAIPGDELVQRLREDPATSHVPLGLMSSARPRLPELAGVPFLPKPFDLIDLIDFIRRHARSAR